MGVTIILGMINKLRLLVARVLNTFYYTTGVKVFREMSNRFALGIHVKVDDTWYVLTCVSDLLEIIPEYERKVFNKLFEVSKSGLVFIDVGAHIGRYSFPIAKLVGGNGLVVAIEPDPLAFKALLMGIKLNNLCNVLALNIAIGDTEGKAILCQKLVTATSSIIEFDKCQKFIEVPLRRLDSVVEELKLRHVDVIKIDVEGAEIQVLKGAINTIARFKPFLVVEVRDRNVNEFLQIMECLRYFCEELAKGAIDKVFLCHSIG
jgi:FkbM family methyltransferase